MSSCWPWPVVLGSGSVFLIAGRFFRQRFGVQQHLLFLIAGVQILIFGILIATVNLDIVFKIDRLSKLAFRAQKHAPDSTRIDHGRQRSSFPSPVQARSTRLEAQGLGGFAWVSTPKGFSQTSFLPGQVNMFAPILPRDCVLNCSALSSSGISDAAEKEESSRRCA